MIPRAGANHVLQIKMLQFVVSEVGESKCEKSLAEIRLTADSSADFVRGRLGWADGIVFSVHGGCVHGNLVLLGYSRGFRRQRVVDRRGIPARQVESRIE